MRSPKRKTVAIAVAALVVVGAVVAVVVRASSHQAVAPKVTRQEPPPPDAKGYIAQPAGSFSVTSYGADPTGTTDAAAAIQDAIDAAVAKGGWQTVYFPTGTYLLNDNNGRHNDFLLKDDTVNILGAGQAYTKIVEEVGTYAYPSLARGKNVFAFEHMSDFYVDGLTVDSQTYNAGDTIDDYGDDSTLENLTLLGAKNGSGGTVDRNNVYDMRVITGSCNANPGSPDNYGNIVKNIVLNGRGIGANDDLVFSCQDDGTVSDVTDTGWGMGLYIDRDITVSDYTFRPDVPTNPELRGFYITDGHDITIDDFTTYGEGGRIATCVGVVPAGNPCLEHPSTDITINGLDMETTSGTDFQVEDVTNLTIENSTLGTLYIDPDKLTNGVTVTATTYQKVKCDPAPGAKIENLVGVRCGGAS
jgi:Pectate lyase superfamily protein